MQSATALPQAISPSPFTTACASPRSSDAPNLVATQGIARMHADADNISGLDALGHNLLERFIDQDWGARGYRSCRGKHKQPTGCDDCCSKRIVAWVNQMNTRRALPFQVRASSEKAKPGSRGRSGLHRTLAGNN